MLSIKRETIEKLLGETLPHYTLDFPLQKEVKL